MGSRAIHIKPPRTACAAIAVAQTASVEVSLSSLEELADAKKLIQELQEKLQQGVDAVKQTFEASFDDIQEDDIPQPGITQPLPDPFNPGPRWR